MNNSRFEVVFYEGEPEKRLPAEWAVVEWNSVSRYENGKVIVKSGENVWTSYDMVNGEIDAIIKAYELNARYYSGE